MLTADWVRPINAEVIISVINLPKDTPNSVMGSITKPGTSQRQSMSRPALTKTENRPSVKKLMGSVSSLMMGLTILLTSVKTMDANTMVVQSVYEILGSNSANKKSVMPMMINGLRILRIMTRYQYTAFTF